MTPDQLLTFAATNVIRPGMLKNTKSYGRAERLELVDVPNETGVAPNGAPSRVCYVKQAGGTSGGFKAYVCDYKEGEINYQVLSHEAPFCFTTTINGCTFALGNPAPDGSMIVSHTNMKSDKMDPQDRVTRGAATQTEFQQSVATEFHGAGQFVDPTVYWAGGDTDTGLKINVTVFGVYKAGWTFYYQRWTRSGASKVNKLLDLNAFGTNSKAF